VVIAQRFILRVAFTIFVAVVGLLSLAPVMAAAQSFETAPTFPTTFHPNMVAVGDLDRDGIADLAVPSYSTKDLSVLLGDGSGFAPLTPYPTDSGSRHAALADFNGDSVLDAAVANVTSGTVSILIGDGAGGFQDAVNIAVGAMPYHVAIGDVNGDGRPDLAVANSGSGTVSVLLGNGVGGFGPSTQFLVGTEPRSTAIADFNQDGHLDLAAANYGSANVSILLGSGTGSFGLPANVAVGAGPHWMAAADLNGDFIPDLAVPNFLSGTVSVLLGNGLGGFVAAGTPLAGKSPRDVAIADFNGDGRRDLAVANRDGNTVSILIGTGAGAFAPDVEYGVGNGPFSVAGGDFNGDGRMDLVTANRDGMTVSVLMGTGLGTFVSPVPRPVGNNPRGLVSADFNGDGHLDLAAMNAKGNDVTVLLGDGAGHTTVAGTFGTKLGPHAGVAADFNEDGRVDLAVAAASSNKVSLLLNNGPAGFSDAINYQGGAAPMAIVTADFNNDSHADVATASSRDGTVLVLLGNGMGGFAAPVSYPVGTSPSGLATADFNGDGRIDIAASNSGSNDVSILLGTGTGAFGTAVFAPTGPAPSSLAAADLNGDLIPDLAVASGAGMSVSILLGNGTGGVQPAGTIPVGESPLAIVSADFNGDSRMDLAVANAVSSLVSILMGDGAGGFQAEPALTAGLFSRALAVGDFNGDGEPDLVSANASANDVWIYMNAHDAIPTLTLSIDDAAAAEGGNATFVVRLSQPSAEPVTVQASTIDGSAVAPVDYAAASATLTFEPGVTLLPFVVPVAADSLAEGAETFAATLSAASIGTIARTSATATIAPSGGLANLTVHIDDGTTEVTTGGATQYMVSIANQGPSNVTAATVSVPLPLGGIGAHWTCAVTAGSNCQVAGDNGINQFIDVTAGGSVVFTWTVTIGPAAGSLTATATIGLPAGITDSDPTDNVSTDTNTIVVTPAPVAENGSAATSEDTAVGIVLSATDPNGDVLTYAIVSAPQRGTLSGTAPNLTYTPTPNFHGTDTFTFRASDGLHESNLATISIEVASVNDAPSAQAQSVAATEDTPRVIVLSATDPDGQAFTFQVSAPQHGVLSGTAPNLTYTPAANYGGPDSFTFSVSDGTATSTPATVSVSVTPVNDAPSVATSIVDVSVASGTASSTVDLSAIFADPDIQTSDDRLGLAVSGNSNPALVSASLSGTVLTLQYAAGQTGSAVVSIRAADIAGAAAEDTFVVSVRPPGPSLTVADTEALEGNGLRFTLSLSSVASSTVSVNYTTADLTGTAGTDYVPASGVVTFTPGVLSRTVTIVGVLDTLDEDNETMRLVLSGATNASLGNAVAVGSIVDDDVARLSVSATAGTEGAAGATVTFAIALSVPSSHEVSVAYTTANENAVAGMDYTATAGRLTFAAGTNTPQIVTVEVLDDSLDEVNEVLSLVLSDAVNASIQTARGYATIVDDDEMPVVTVTSETVVESDSGTREVVFTLTLSAPSGRPVQVTYATADGSALAGADYAAKSRAVVFDPGVSVRTASIYVIGDGVVEPEEVFFLNLSAPINTTIGVSQGVGTIADNDGV
jgi:hypothetical protein